MVAEAALKGSQVNVAKAAASLETVRRARGVIAPLSGLDAGQLFDELTREYRKEFVSEGVIWLFYKRNGLTTLPRTSREITDAEYVLPMPEIDANYYGVVSKEE
jgi:hypothetical protein